jgi:hypothetical protein
MTVDNVHNINSTISALNGYAIGGLFGRKWHNSGPLSNSHSTANVTGRNNIGGLIGENYGAITDSYATGNVTGCLTADYGTVGGLVGYHEFGAMTNASASGNVLSQWGSVGGLIGYAYHDAVFTNVTASGTVRSNNTGNVGGLIGYMLYTATISNSSYTGTSVYGAGGNVGGFIGYSHDRTISITNSFVGDGSNRVSIRAGDGVGGFLGYTRSGATITNSYVANANITGSTYVGGLVGASRRNGITVNSSYAGGSGGTNVTGSNFVGGLVGEMMGGSLNNSYFAGAVNGSSSYGGIVGFLKPGAILSNTYYNVSASLINGNATLTIGGLYGKQFADWVSSNVSVVASRSFTGLIGNYFDLDTDGYYKISSNTMAIDSTSITKNDLSNLGAFVQGDVYGNVTPYKFKLTADLDTATAVTKFVPYFGATEFKGSSFATNYNVNNFSWSPNTSNVGFLGNCPRLRSQIF